MRREPAVHFSFCGEKKVSISWQEMQWVEMSMSDAFFFLIIHRMIIPGDWRSDSRRANSFLLSNKYVFLPHGLGSAAYNPWIEGYFCPLVLGKTAGHMSKIVFTQSHWSGITEPVGYFRHWCTTFSFFNQ